MCVCVSFFFIFAFFFLFFSFLFDHERELPELARKCRRRRREYNFAAIPKNPRTQSLRIRTSFRSMKFLLAIFGHDKLLSDNNVHLRFRPT